MPPRQNQPRLIAKPPEGVVRSVLLVESEGKERDHYSGLISEVSNCRVDAVSHPGQSFDEIVRTCYDIAIIDPVDGSGLELLERIKRVSPRTSVIWIASDVTVEHAIAAIKMGAEDVFSKPFNPEKFKLSVKRALDRQMVFEEDRGIQGYLSLLNSCQMISSSLDQARAFDILRGYLSKELNCALIAVYGADGVRVGAAGSTEEQTGGLFETQGVEEMLDIAVAATSPLETLKAGTESHVFIERSRLTPALFAMKFLCGEEEPFFAVGLSPRKPPNEAEFGSRLAMIRRQLEVTGRNIKEFKGVRELIYRDDATGLYNTRYLHEILDHEIQEHHRTGQPFAVLFIDADRFKQVNDQHGHLIGTRLLNEFGRQLRSWVRERDTVFRYGGDEFIAVLTPCDLKVAQVIAERIRENVERAVFLSDEGLNVHFTASIGVALFPEHADSKRKIIEMADSAMYAAKKTARNAVVVAKRS